MSFSCFEQTFHVTPFAAVTSCVVLFLTIIYLVVKDRGLPPGPIGLPFVGYWPFLKDETIRVQLHELTLKHGDVFSFRIAGKLFIVLGSIKAIKEALITKSDSFSKRFTDYSSLSISFGEGIITRNGEEWKVIRKFFLQAFKEYGITSVKDYMCGPIYDSVSDITATLKETNGSAINIVPILNSKSLAILRRMMFNDNEATEKEIQDILKSYEKLVDLFLGKKLLLVGDFAKKFLFPRIKCHQEAIEGAAKMKRIFKNIVKRHEDTFDRNNIRDIIDSYIKERKDRVEKGDPTAKYFSEDGLVGSLMEFVGDGIHSVSIFATYFIHKLLEYPDEQEKIYQELVDVVGPDRGVTLEDKSNLPYTNAFMTEVIRMINFLPFFSSLECTKETTLNGYKIPVGAITVTNFWSAHHDPLVFDEPEVFKPSRYLTVKGKPKTEAPVPFGVGKRSCIGESYTMMQCFLFMATIVKNFRIVSTKGDLKKFISDGKLNICAYARK